MVAANSDEDKARWMEDLSNAITAAKKKPDDTLKYPSLKSISKIYEMERMEIINKILSFQALRTKFSTRVIRIWKILGTTNWFLRLDPTRQFTFVGTERPVFRSRIIDWLYKIN